MKRFIVMASVFCCLFGAQESYGSHRTKLPQEERGYRKKALREDFDKLMQAIASSIDVYDILVSTSAPEGDIQKLIDGFKTNIWPLILSELEPSEMSKKKGWLVLVQHVRNYDKREASRDDEWYLSRLMSLTKGIARNATNDRFLKGLREAQ